MKTEAAVYKLPVLGALSLFLSTVEYMIPKPLPFLRLGLANAPLLIALRFPPSTFFTLVFIKIFGQALISGTLFSYIFLLSLTGTMASASCMYILRRIVSGKYMSLAGISVTGSLVSNFTQIALARFFFMGEAAVYIVPPFLAAGIVSGMALGLFCERFIEISRWYKRAPPEILQPPPINIAVSVPDTGGFPLLLFFCGLSLSFFMLLTTSFSCRLILFAIFLIAAVFSGKAGNLLFTLVFFLLIVMFNALSPYGRVIFEAGVFRLTEGALMRGIERAVTVEGLVMLSRVTISSRLRLPGRVGGLLSEAFLLLPRFYEKKTAIHVKTFMQDIDTLLLELSEQKQRQPEP
ncbi:MAG: Gx transporter family protein [Treponema sp.]|nr:Gx transporter family protein [Treponema sp.]